MTGNQPSGAKAVTLVAPSRSATRYDHLRLGGRTILILQTRGEQGVEAASVGAQDLKADAAQIDDFLAPGNASQLVQNQDADCIAVDVAEIRSDDAVEIVNSGLCLDAVAAGMVHADVVFGFVKIVFIFNVADNLFEYILDGDQPTNAGVFIDDDRHVIVRHAEFTQQDVKALGVGDKNDRTQPVTQIESFFRFKAE